MVAQVTQSRARHVASCPTNKQHQQPQWRMDKMATVAAASGATSAMNGHEERRQKTPGQRGQRHVGTRRDRAGSWAS